MKLCLAPSVTSGHFTSIRILRCIPLTLDLSPKKKGITAGIERCVFVTYAIDKSNIKNAYEEAFDKAYYQVVLWKLLTLPVLAFFS